jgi:WD40 repeat protein
VRLFDLRTQAQLHELDHGGVLAYAVQFSPDGRRIMLAGGEPSVGISRIVNNSVRVHEVKSGKLVASLGGHRGVVTQAAMRGDGRQILSAAKEELRVWDVFPTPQHLIEQAKALLPTCLTQAERERAFLEVEPPDWCIDLQKWPYNTQTWRDRLAAKRAGQTAAAASAQ